ncbi:hypothetical protein [Nocardia sp. NPDC005998]|uniref:hypothetical protein n=1 Tax=Nocardia sp. NPDC005998 TaxID=3156894 RepID=UPI0033BB79AE
MNDRVELNPDGLRRSANEFDELVDETKKLLETLKSSSGSKGEAWGDDKSGHKFADGDKGYIKNRDNTFESLSKVAEVFGANAKNLRDSATTFEKNEQEQSRLRPQNQDRGVLQREQPRYWLRNRDRSDVQEESGRLETYSAPRRLRRTESSIPATDPVSREGTEQPREAPLAPRRFERSIPGTDPVSTEGTEQSWQAPLAQRADLPDRGREPLRAGETVQAPMARRADYPNRGVEPTQPLRARETVQAPMARRADYPNRGTEPTQPLRAGETVQAPMARRLRGSVSRLTPEEHVDSPRHEVHAHTRSARIDRAIPASNPVSTEGDVQYPEGQPGA